MKEELISNNEYDEIDIAKYGKKKKNSIYTRRSNKYIKIVFMTFISMILILILFIYTYSHLSY